LLWVSCLLFLLFLFLKVLGIEPRGSRVLHYLSNAPALLFVFCIWDRVSLTFSLASNS
jgi:hypothetical protein